MGKTYRAEPNPERAARAQKLRASGAAGLHQTNVRGRTRLDAERAAIEDSLEESAALNTDDFDYWTDVDES